MPHLYRCHGDEAQFAAAKFRRPEISAAPIKCSERRPGKKDKSVPHFYRGHVGGEISAAPIKCSGRRPEKRDKIVPHFYRGHRDEAQFAAAIHVDALAIHSAGTVAGAAGDLLRSHGATGSLGPGVVFLAPLEVAAGGGDA